MSKLFSLLSAGALALAASAFVVAAEDPWDGYGRMRQAQSMQGAPEEKEQEYLAALKKCESISNRADRQTCIDVIKRKYGQM